MKIISVSFQKFIEVLWDYSANDHLGIYPESITKNSDDIESFSGVTILAFAKSLSVGFTVLGISFMFPYLLYEFYNEC